MNKEIKTPKQERSIQKRQLIIETGFNLFSQKGYYHTNTAEIAKAAGVSTGIIYRYFPDKKAIFMAGFSNYMSYVVENIKEKLDCINSIDNIEAVLRNLIQYSIEIHFVQREVHEEVNAMIHSDPDIAKVYYEWEDNVTQVVVSSFPRLSLNIENSEEKVHMIIHMIENYCHEVVFHKHSDMNYDAMKNILIKSIITIFKM